MMKVEGRKENGRMRQREVKASVIGFIDESGISCRRRKREPVYFEPMYSRILIRPSFVYNEMFCPSKN